MYGAGGGGGSTTAGSGAGGQATASGAGKQQLLLHDKTTPIANDRKFSVLKFFTL